MQITWKKMVELEPELGELLERIQRFVPGKNYCRNRTWYGHWIRNERIPGFKAHMKSLVGFCSYHKNDPILGSEMAYRIAYRKLYDSLPPCKCGCE